MRSVITASTVAANRTMNMGSAESLSYVVELFTPVFPMALNRTAMSEDERAAQVCAAFVPPFVRVPVVGTGGGICCVYALPGYWHRSRPLFHRPVGRKSHVETGVRYAWSVFVALALDQELRRPRKLDARHMV